MNTNKVRTCRKCNKEKNIDLFKYDRGATIPHVCKECRQERLDKLLVRKCIKCNIERNRNDFIYIGLTGNSRSKICNHCKKQEEDKKQEEIRLFKTGYKVCFKCKQLKNLIDFSNNKKTHDGKCSYCRPCFKLINKQYPEDHEKRLMAKKRYRMKNKEAINKIQNEKQNKNRFRFMKYRANSSSRKKSSGESITAFQLWCVAKKQKLRCAISGVKLDSNNISLDHILPFARGGKNTIDNIQFVTYDVNMMKQSHTQEEFLELIKIIYNNNFNHSNE